MNQNQNINLAFAIEKCDLGLVLVAMSSKGIRAIFLGDSAESLIQHLHASFPRMNLLKGDNPHKEIAANMAEFIAKPTQTMPFTLHLQGTPFQLRVWNALRKIPLGKTASYSTIASQIGSPTAARAVAQACKANSLAVAVPCHRVICQNGSLSGYRWGIKRKQALLEREYQHS